MYDVHAKVREITGIADLIGKEYSNSELSDIVHQTLREAGKPAVRRLKRVGFVLYIAADEVLRKAGG